MHIDIYCRISEDKTGQRAGVKRQQEDCERLAAERGWTVHRVLIDNDTSAYKRVARPGYAQLVEDLKAGAVKGVVVWHPDRLTRRPRELEDLIDLLDATKAKVATVMSGEYDLSTASGRMSARIVGAVARNESERISERVCRANIAHAEAGRPAGGLRQFGYQKGGLVLHEAEAAEVRLAYSRVLDEGWSMRRVMGDWNSRGVFGTQGKPWGAGNVRKLLAGPRIAGYRQHNGKLHEAAWPAIVDREEWEQMRALALDHARRCVGRPRSYLLLGVAVCGKCGTKLISQASQTTRTSAGTASYKSYRCAPSTNRVPGCGGVRRHAEKLEAFVQAAVTEALAGNGYARALQARSKDDPGTRELAEALGTLESKLERLQQLLVDGDLAQGDYRRHRAETEAEMGVLRGQLADRAGRRMLATVPAGEHLVGWWEDAAPEQRRALVGLVLERVVVKPARRGDNRFDPSLIELVWRG